MQISNEMKADILVQALPYIKKYTGQIIVVKYGGNAMTPEMKQSVMKDLVLLRQIGVKVVLVHGGGPEIDDMLSALGKKSEFIGGLRKTDADTMQVVQMVLAGKVNKELVNLIELSGGKAVGLCGVDGRMIEVEKISDELGYVGNVTKVDTYAVMNVLDAGYIPVIATIGAGADGEVYNVNADAVAASVAGALKAKCLISMTDKMGILRDVNDTSSLIKLINVSDAPRLIKEGVISGGMLPKVECCVEAIRRGVKSVFILDGRISHAILIEILSDEGMGTMFV